METLKERIEHIKQKRPGMGAILDFYQKVREAQEHAKASLKCEPLLLKKEWKEFLAKQGFPLLEKKGFPLDIDVSFSLFQSLCRIGREANPRMADEVKKTEEAILNKKLDLKRVLRESHCKEKIEQSADDLGFDRKIFQFLIENAVRPSIEAAVEQLRNEFDVKDWTRGYCPMCGSLPFLSLMKEEAGKRHLLCSCCGYQWRIERLICPFCSNDHHESLHYFYGEGEESFRMDLCDQCHHYIKTIDLRTLPESDPYLEDIATLYLDLIASQKGYRRPVPNLWIP